MKIRIQAIVEQGETKRDVRNKLSEGYNVLFPCVSVCVSSIHRLVTVEGRLNEFKVDVDVWFMGIKRQIKNEVEARIKEQCELRCNMVETTPGGIPKAHPIIKGQTKKGKRKPAKKKRKVKK